MGMLGKKTGGRNSKTQSNLSLSNTDAINRAKKDYAAAAARGDKTGMSAAHNAAEAVRATEGYSGGVDGSQYNPFASKNDTYGQFQDKVDTSYAELQRQQEAAKRAAIEQGVNRLESNRGKINQGYDDTARQAYIQKMQNEQALPQMLAGQGIQGGGTESAKIALDTSYGNNISTNEKSRQNALVDIDNAVADLRNTGDISIADSNLELGRQQLSDYQNSYAQKLQQDNLQKQFEQEQADKNRQRAIETVGAHYQDYMAYINQLKNDGDPSNDYLINYAMMERNQKLAEQADIAAQQEQNDYDRWLDQQNLSVKWYNAQKSGRKSSKKSSKKSSSSGSSLESYLKSILG